MQEIFLGFIVSQQSAVVPSFTLEDEAIFPSLRRRGARDGIVGV